MTSLAKAARDLRAARARVEAAMKAAQVVALAEYSAGMPETEIAKALGVNRMTVRRWLGKST